MPKLTPLSISLIILHYGFIIGALALGGSEKYFAIVGLWASILFLIGFALIIPIMVVIALDNPESTTKK